MNKLNYDKGYWPVSIDSIHDDETLRYVEEKLWLIQLPPREKGYNVFADKNINEASIRKLSESSEGAWRSILARDTKAWGENTRKCFEAQLEMFPHAATAEVMYMIERCRGLAYGWKLTGAGGGGYLILISDQEIPNSIKVHIR